jgi:Matrixin
MQVPGECITEGIPLFWPVSCINYAFQKDASIRVAYDDVSTAADAAFQTWGHAACATGVTPTLEFLNLGAVTCDRHEYNDQSKTFGGNANVIIFHDDGFDPATMDQQLAITTVTFNVNTGEIYDADIEVDGSKSISALTPVPMLQYDLQSILTHEFGHFLGLAHSNTPCQEGIGCATMDATYRTGTDDFRSLEPDDIAGICTIYPPDRSAIDNACAPRHGFSSECGVPPRKGCCTTAPGGASTGGGEAALAMLMGVGLWFARGRRT